MILGVSVCVVRLICPIIRRFQCTSEFGFTFEIVFAFVETKYRIEFFRWCNSTW
eukprot:m.1646113 g.1646113  ORF g.1646113 m.1646113 type:complete len:54 (-) comp69708_c0_seq1:115-276(-)